MPSQNAILHHRSRRLGAIDTLALAAGGYDATVLGDSPFAFWKLNETSGTAAADATGNGHGGTYTGSPTLGVTGAFDKGVTLNGSTQYISVTSLTGLAIGACTIEAIIKYTSGTGCVFSFGGSSLNTLNDFRVNNSTQMFYYWFSDDYTQTVAALAAAWHHVAAVYTGTKRQIFVDGVQQGADNTPSGSPTWTLADLAIGSLRASAEFFNGSMQRVAYYQSALSAATLLTHFNAIAVS